MEEKKYKLIQESALYFTDLIEKYEKEGFRICSNISTVMIQDTIYNTVLMENINQAQRV